MTRSVERWVQAAFIVGLGVSIALAQSALTVLVALWLLQFRDPEARAGLTFPLAAPFAGFIGASLLAALLSADVPASLFAAKKVLLVSVFFVLVNTLRDSDGAARFLERLFLVVVGVSALSVLQVALCPAEPWPLSVVGRWLSRCGRARGFYSIYMTLAGVLTLVLLAWFPRLLGRASAPRRWELPAWLLMLGALILTWTRGAWLGFVAGAGALAPVARRGRALALICGSILLILVLVGAGSLAAGGQIRGFRNMVELGTVRERLYMWQTGFRLLQLSPVTGIGPGQVKTHYSRYALPGAEERGVGHLHSSPLQVLVETGVLGFASWVWLWVAFFVRGFRILQRAGPGQERERALIWGSLAAILGFLVAGLTENNFADSEVLMVAYTVMAIPFLVEPSLSARDPGTRYSAVQNAPGETAPAHGRGYR